MTRQVALIALIAILTFVVVFGVPASAEEQPNARYAYSQLEDTTQEARAQKLITTLRCLQCQGQSIADSDAPIAGSMWSLVRERIAKGDDPEEIQAWLIGRYGDYVSYAPRLTELTWPLFAIPMVLVLLTGALLRERFGGREKE